VLWPATGERTCVVLDGTGRRETDPAVEDRLRVALTEWMRIGDALDGAGADPETEAALRALGYIR